MKDVCAGSFWSLDYCKGSCVVIKKINLIISTNPKPTMYCNLYRIRGHVHVVGMVVFIG